MISAEVIKGVQELLEERGVRQETEENFADFVARGLGTSRRQTEILLEALHDGNNVEDAARRADIDLTGRSDNLLVQLARVIGTTLGRIAPN